MKLTEKQKEVISKIMDCNYVINGMIIDSGEKLPPAILFQLKSLKLINTFKAGTVKVTILTELGKTIEFVEL